MTRSAPSVGQEDPNAMALARLQRRWFGVAVVFAVALAVATFWLRRAWPAATEGGRPNGTNHAAALWYWVGLAALVLAYELQLVWRRLDRHRRRDQETLLPGLGLGNMLTLGRGLAYGLMAGFLFTPQPDGLFGWFPAVLYTLAGFADYFDGYLARRSGYASALGEVLDMEFDALGVLVVALLAIHFGQWPLVFLVIGLARYAFVIGLALRRRRSLPVRALPPSNTRRVLAGLQMGFMTVVLWPVTPPVIAILAGVMFGAPFLLVFTRDWLVVSDALDNTSPSYQRVRRWLLILFTQWLPILVRLLLAAALVGAIWEGAVEFDRVAADLAAFGFPAGTLTLAIFLLIEMIGLPFIALGAAARVWALFLLIPTGFGLVAANIMPAGVALFGAIYLLIFGSGGFSLWTPEEQFFARRAGE